MKRNIVLLALLPFCMNLTSMQMQRLLGLSDVRSQQRYMYQPLTSNVIIGSPHSAFKPFAQIDDAQFVRDFSDIVALHRHYLNQIYSDPKEFSTQQIAYEIQHNDFPGHEEWHKEKEGPLFYKVLRIPQGLVAVASYFLLKIKGIQRARIVDFLIVPEYCPSDYGTKLLAHVFTHLKSLDVKSVELYAMSTDQNGCKFYEDKGFKRVYSFWSHTVPTYCYSREI